MIHLLHHLVLAANPYAIPTDGIVTTGNSSVGGGLGKVITLMLTLVGSLSVIFIIVGGLLMVLSAGNPARFKQGREAVIYACVGLGVSIAALAIVTFLSSKL